VPKEYTPEEIRSLSDADRERLNEEMAGRIMRYDTVQPDWDAFREARLPDFRRAVYKYVGAFALETSDVQAPVEGDHFSFGLTYVEPGRGAPLHAHTTEEVFFPLCGTWQVFWGDPGQLQRATLNAWDAISLPGPVMRGFRNVGREDAWLLVMLGGGSPPPPVYHESVVEQTEQWHHQHSP